MGGGGSGPDKKYIRIKSLDDLAGGAGFNKNEAHLIKKYDFMKRLCNYTAASVIALGLLVSGYGKLRHDHLEKNPPAEIGMYNKINSSIINAQNTYELELEKDTSRSDDFAWMVSMQDKISGLRDEQKTLRDVIDSYDEKKMGSTVIEINGIVVGLMLGGLFYGLKSIYEGKINKIVRRKTDNMRIV